MYMKRNSCVEKETQDTIFLKESSKVYIQMSDGQKIFCQYSLGDKTKSDIVFFFVQGFASGYFTWNDFWDALHQEFNLVIVDPREKKSNKLMKSSECSVHRIALDLAEAIKFLKLDEKKLVLFGSSIGASYVAHLVGQNMITSKGCFLTGPARKPRAPSKLINIFSLFPAFVLNSLGKLVARIYFRNKVADGFQKQVFYDRIKNADLQRWKPCRDLHYWDATEDFKKMKIPVFIVRTPDDKYHESDEIQMIHELILNSKFIDIQSYDYCHTKPSVYEFTQTIKKTILEEM